jgi:hypothetical protein
MALDRKDHSYRIVTLDNEIMAELEHDKTAQEIAAEIVDQLPSIFSDDLRRLITEAIETERERVREWKQLISQG